MKRPFGVIWGFTPVTRTDRGGYLPADAFIVARINFRAWLGLAPHTYLIGFGWLVCLFRGHLWCHQQLDGYECIRCGSWTFRPDITPTIRRTEDEA